MYKAHGVTLNRTAAGQYSNGVAVDKSNLQPGDILIFKNTAKTEIGHVGIYIGNGQVLHASNPKQGIKISPVGYRTIHSIRRIIND